MLGARLFLSRLVVPCWLLAACSGASTQPAGRPTASACPTWPALKVRALEPGEEAMELQPRCTAGAAEACNALDEDCDAVIDEGCGYMSGPLQVVVQWNRPADVDLHIEDPTGAELTPRQRIVPSGGRLDRFAYGACRSSDPPPRLENAFWKRMPDAGRYVVSLELVEGCGAALPVTATVSLRLADAPVRTFNVQLAQPGQRVVVVRLRLGDASNTSSAR